MKDVMKYKDYIASMHFSPEDEVFFGKIEGIDDSVTFEGSSVSELKSAFHEAAEDYMAICEEAGKDPRKSYKGSFNVRIASELHKKAAYKSIEKGISLNQLVEEAIANFLSKDSPGDT